MNSEMKEGENREISIEPEDLKPKRPSNRAPEGIRTFTVCRQHDESGVSGDGVVIEGVNFATGHTVIHWLTPAPRGSIAFFDANKIPAIAATIPDKAQIIELTRLTGIPI